MTAVTITLFSLLTIQFLLIGCVIGYILVREMFLRQMQSPYMHPEMLDEYGNVLPDEILAVRFENDYETEDNEEDDNN